MPKLSVLIPVYNVEPYLRHCLDTVLGQSWQDMEVIAVNDGSKDGSLAILREYEKRDSRLVVIDQPNKGVSAARNACLKHAQGDFILFIDADDWIEKEMLEQMLQEFEVHPEADIVFCCNAVTNSENAAPLCVTQLSDELWPPERQRREFLLHRTLTGMLWNKMMRRRLFEGLLFDEAVGFGEDAQMLWKVLKRSRNMKCMPQVLYYHRINDASISGTFSESRFAALKVWQEIADDPSCTAGERRQALFHLAANATYFLYEMRRAGHKNKEYEAIMRRLVRKHLLLILTMRCSIKHKLYAAAVAAGIA